MAKDENGLTGKQAAFALAYFETGNAAEAYRRAYDVSENARDDWIYVEACQLLDHPKISIRLKQLEEQAASVAIYTRAQAMAELEEARMLAHNEGQAGAAVSAISAKTKLFGLERAARMELTGRNGDPIKTEETGQGAAKLAAFLGGIAERSRDTGEPDGG